MSTSPDQIKRMLQKASELEKSQSIGLAKNLIALEDKIDNIKPTDTTDIKDQLKTITDKINEHTEVELNII